jgi:hypothetical protein
MKTYYLNMVLDDSDDLVASYDSLGELRTCWKQDAHDWLTSNSGESYNTLGSGVSWYPYFTGEDDNGDIRELSPDEVLEGVA